MTDRHPQRRPRIKSAQARLETTPSGLNSIDYSRTARVQSARHLKRQHEASRYVFPDPPLDSALSATTSYREHFVHTFGRPATARPTSSTRRNKPHPAPRFMTWTLPTKVVDHPRARGPSQETLMDTNEAFYEDYAGDRNVGDSKNEVLTQLTTLPFPGASLKDTNDLHLTGTRVAFEKDASSSLQEKPLSKKEAQELMGRSIKASASSALKKWSETATEEERETVLRMLSESSQEEQMQTLLDVVNPDVMPGVETWLKTAAETDKAVVYQMLHSLKDAKELARASNNPRMTRRAKQTNTLGTTRRARLATYPQVQVSELPRFVGDDYNRWVYAMETGKDIPLHRDTASQRPNVLWHHKAKRDTPPVAHNRGSIFGAAPKYPAQHFAIIPEWPIA